mgnify:CR=1 FL=1
MEATKERQQLFMEVIVDFGLSSYLTERDCSRGIDRWSDKGYPSLSPTWLEELQVKAKMLEESQSISEALSTQIDRLKSDIRSLKVELNDATNKMGWWHKLFNHLR